MTTDPRKADTSEPTPAESLVEGPVPMGRWRLDVERSRLGFRVKRMGVYYVKGWWRGFEGSVEARSGGETVAEATIDAASIHTRIPPRDAHLRSRQFLDVKSHPQIRFQTENVEAVDRRTFRVLGTIEIHGRARPLALRGHAHAEAGAPPVLHLKGVLSRHDFDIRAPQPFEMIVGKDVHLEVELALERATPSTRRRARRRWATPAGESGGSKKTEIGRSPPRAAIGASRRRHENGNTAAEREPVPAR